MPNRKDIPVKSYSHERKDDLPFTLKTMEEIYDASEGKTDVPHRHEYFTVVWVIEARGLHYIDFLDYNLEANQVYFIHPEQVHAISLEKRPKGVVLTFTSDFLIESGIDEKFVLDLKLFESCTSNPPIEIDKSIANRLHLIITQLKYEIIKSDSYNYAAIGSLLKLFLIECYRSNDEKRHKKKLQFAGSIDLVSRFKTLVESNFKKMQKVKDYASMLVVTPNYLNEVISQATGKSAKEYIQDRIILEAKRLIVFSQLNLKQIAFELGYEDYAYFSRVFKNHQNITFSSYEKVNRKKYN
ncbi:MAG: helix-turn-helix transcriptional regulator [Melioribacteraceae bacterium]|nr:helix-turn-helix transcriptional regulator [Melioribacteraceae bacterium]MCO6474419.1 helix-turn-helix domain-containing protein [Melioribacteraceae bacterium]